MILQRPGDGGIGDDDNLVPHFFAQAIERKGPCGTIGLKGIIYRKSSDDIDRPGAVKQILCGTKEIAGLKRFANLGHEAMVLADKQCLHGTGYGNGLSFAHRSLVSR